MLPLQKTKHLLSCVRRAADDYEMIAEGDRIAVGLSGGKDSVALLCSLALLRRFYPKPFSLTAITVDMGLPGVDFTPMQTLCRELDLPYFIIGSSIAEIVFKDGHGREETPPAGGFAGGGCSLCAKLRRGILFDEAEKQGCNRIALGHHSDDAAVTFLMNLLNEGRIDCFAPLTHFPERGISLIRPLLYADEDDIRYFMRVNALPTVSSACPADGHTDRERYAQLLRTLEKERKGTRHRILKAMEKAGVAGFRESKANGRNAR